MNDESINSALLAFLIFLVVPGVLFSALSGTRMPGQNMIENVRGK